MTTRERKLAAARAQRDLAREVFDTRLASLRASIDERGLGSRVAGAVAGEASHAFDTGLDVARENKGLIAGTIAALLVWIFRQPLFGACAALYERVRGASDDEFEEEIGEQDD